MILWKVKLSNGREFDENSILHETTKSNLSPWLVLDDYCTKNNLFIDNIALFDSETNKRLFSPGTSLGSLKSDSIDYRRRYVSSHMGSSIPDEYIGLIIKKNNVSFGVWINSKTKDINTTIEPD